MDKSNVRRDTLDPNRPFPFSQGVLQDFDDCARRFQLRYLLQLAWPAPQAEPVQENEQHIRRGERFHRLAHQALLDVPLERLAASAQADADPQLAVWWSNFARLLPTVQAGERHPECILSAPLGKHRLLARFDLIQHLPDENRFVIWDWKTSPVRSKRAWLEQRMQTRVYPYMLASAGKSLNGGQDIAPEQIEMVYWFAAHPDQPERIEYTAQLHQRNQRALLGMLREIESMQAEQFVKTTDEKQCRFCVYRSLCERGIGAGNFAEREEEPASNEIDLDFDQIAEISF